MPSSYSVLGYLVDSFAALVLFLTVGLVLSGEDGGGSWGQSACEVMGGGVVTALLAGGLLDSKVAGNI